VSTALLWLRRDLRLHDQPALLAALDGAETVVPVFCFDDGLLKGRHASGPRTHPASSSESESDSAATDVRPRQRASPRAGCAFRAVLRLACLCAARFGDAGLVGEHDGLDAVA
jgi:hypothetical protein